MLLLLNEISTEFDKIGLKIKISCANGGRRSLREPKVPRIKAIIGPIYKLLIWINIRSMSVGILLLCICPFDLML